MNNHFVRRLTTTALIVIVAIFAMILTVVYIYERRELLESAQQEAQRNTEHAAQLICDRLNAAEIAIVNSPRPTKESDRFAIIQGILKNNPDICGSAIALKQEVVQSWQGKDYYMIYAYRDGWKKDI